MDRFKLYTSTDLDTLISKRVGEQKLGQQIQLLGDLNQLASSNATFVLLGIPEDIGIRANQGIGGAKTAWEPALRALLNIQSNKFLQGSEILLLGHFEIEEPIDQSVAGLRKKTSEIDELIVPIIEAIVIAGKIPIVIGGGHNNAFPIITGVSKALAQAINTINIDAHADLRNIDEGRHSGNGFSSALEQRSLNQYRVFGLHENYMNDQLLNALTNDQKVTVFYFEDLLREDQSISESFNIFTKGLQDPCGLEIDLDSIQNVVSSAVSPSGFSLNDVRKIIFNGKNNYRYLHICEGAQELVNGNKQEGIGKVIAYLISDFIKVLRSHTYPQP